MKTCLSILYSLFFFASFSQQNFLDITFGNSGIVTSNAGSNYEMAKTSAIQSDGKIVIGGFSGGAPNQRDFFLMRFHTNGTIDNSFGLNGKVTTTVSGSEGVFSLAVQNDDKILAAGSSSNSSTDFTIIRYNYDGSVDSSFGLAGKANVDFESNYDYCYAIKVQNDGKIVACGLSAVVSASIALARLNPDGSLDTTFDEDGRVITSYGTACSGICMAIQNDGKILAGGEDNSDFTLIRYNADGSLDQSFNSNAQVTQSFGAQYDCVNALAVQDDGKIVAVGYTFNGDDYDVAVARYNPNGDADTTFDSDGKKTIYFVYGNDDRANSVMIRNGKIIIAGFGGPGTGDFAIARLNNDGSLDASFDQDGILMTAIGCGTDLVNSGLIQNDGKIVVAGFSDMCSGVDISLARYDLSTVGVKEQINISKIRLYPNPTEGMIIFRNNETISNVNIYDISGRRITDICFDAKNKTIDIKDVPAGIYFLEIISGVNRYFERIVKK